MKKLGVALIALALLMLGGNYWSAHRPMQAAIDGDPRNAGIAFWAYHHYLIDPQTLVIDVRELDLEKSPADVFRLLLQYAEQQQDRRFERVLLAARGQAKLVLSGEDFQTLGREYATQNPVYTMRTFAERLTTLDGEAAFPVRSGGIIYVLGAQMEDFVAVHQRWYVEEFAGENPGH